MGLPVGSQLGPYAIICMLGAGGMGEVYRARDTRLDRTVAIKVLRPSLLLSPGVKPRFEREARVISQFQHPHICTLYDVGHQDGTDYLVMEFLEGESLAARLQKGALPLDQAVRIGIEIADALDKAHRVGIVHRDLKPSNIMLTRVGAKLLDFGLAKPLNAIASAVDSDGSPPSFTASTLSSPSPVSPLTSQGTILGTIQYMSPEQIAGKETDARSDIFSFGAVLYEMVAGQRAFQGRSQIKVASAILEDEPPPPTAVRPRVSPALDHIITTCLAKDPEHRFQSAADIAVELKWITDSPASPVARPAVSSTRWLRVLPWGLATMVAVVAAVLGMFFVRQEPRFSTHSYILPPENSEFVFTNLSGKMAVSPDGRRLAFTTHVRQQQRDLLWVQPLNSATAQPLAGTEGAAFPFWSPDSRQLGFFAEGMLKKIDANGGPPQTLCDAPLGRGGAWNVNGTILFAPATNSALSIVSDSGGIPSALTQLSVTDSENSHRWPQFLPDGKHFLFFIRSDNPEKSGIFAGSLDSKERRLIVHNAYPGIYASGYLLFLRDGTLMAQPFDISKLLVGGQAVPLAEQITFSEASVYGAFSASDDGVLVFHSGINTTTGYQLAWFNRNGKPEGLAAPEAAAYYQPVLSPDGSRLAFALFESFAKSDIWVLDLKRQTHTRITFGPRQQSNPVWTPDGKYLFYSSVRIAGGAPHVYRKAADGTGAEETVIDKPATIMQVPVSVSHDGRYLVYAYNEGRGFHLWTLPLGGETKPFPLTEARPGGSEWMGAVSPDGHWLAYVSNEGGPSQMYLQRFPQGEGKWQVSKSTAIYAAWRADGKELFFPTGSSELMAVDFAIENGTPRVGTPHLLFRLPPSSLRALGVAPFAVTVDGKRFIVNSAAEGSASRPLTLITNWTADLKK